MLSLEWIRLKGVKFLKMSHLCEKVFVRKYREIRNVTIFLNYDEFFNRIFNFQYKIRRIFRIIIQLLLFQILIVLYKLNV